MNVHTGKSGSMIHTYAHHCSVNIYLNIPLNISYIHIYNFPIDTNIYIWIQGKHIQCMHILLNVSYIYMHTHIGI